MKWVKRFAAGMLAAALSLALLCGCSDSTKLDNVKELKYEDSILYTRTYWHDRIDGTGWAMECTRLSNGQTIIMAEDVLSSTGSGFLEPTYSVLPSGSQK